MKLYRVGSWALLLVCGCAYFDQLARTNKALTHQRAELSSNISIYASGRGNPWMNLADGHDVLTSYSGPPGLIQALQTRAAQPMSLASADFDEDGVPDLICGYSHSSSGIVTWLRGNVDSIYPNSVEAQQRRATDEFTDAPFLSPARVFGLPIEPEFLGAGDFDADGHWDLVAVSRKSDALYFLPGDGEGSFGDVKLVRLPGVVTALVTGEVNRRDGLDDVVVAIKGQDGAKALVFEGPDGALKARPEAIDLPAEAAALALDQFDDQYPFDLAVAAGSELLVVHGRDRKLSLDEESRAEVPQAIITRITLPFAVRSIAAGDFNGNQKPGIASLSEDGSVRLLVEETQEGKGTDRWIVKEVGTDNWQQATALVRARVSGSVSDDLIVVDSASRRLHILSEPHTEGGVGAWKEDSAASLHRDAASLDVGGQPVAVLPMRLNVHASNSLVILQSGTSSPSVVTPQAATIFVVTNTNDSGAGSLRQAILNANSNPGTDTIQFNIPGSGAHTIALTSRVPTVTDPVIIDGTTQPGFAGAPVIEMDGTNALPASPGFQINAGNTTVRGLVINRFKQDGIVAAREKIVIEGNFIGTDVTGAVALGNSFRGVGIFGAARNNLVGGTTASARNIISANRFDGVIISDGATRNQVLGNFIGTDVNGTAKVGNLQSGVIVFAGANNNSIGGTTKGAGNIISGSGTLGIGIYTSTTDTTGNLVQGNLIGTDVTGATKISNPVGILISGASGNSIGGTTVSARNIISGNSSVGVDIFGNGATGNRVQNNYIGTDLTGTVPLGNTNIGLFVSGAGSTLIEDNVISSNGRQGVLLGGFFVSPVTGETGFGGTGAIVQRNFIGTDRTGTINLGNKLDGIFVDNRSFIHTIRDNAIAFNVSSGIRIPNASTDPRITNKIPAVKILIESNSIFDNGSLGIDLGEQGVTANHPKDPTKLEANEGQNFPELSDTTADGAMITIQGKLDKSAPNTTFTIEFFSNSVTSSSGCVREGQHPMQRIQVTTDANGTAPINALLPVAMAGGYINATAIDPGGNTSEFSDCAKAGAARGPDLIKITVTSNVVAVGSGFIKPVRVSLVDKDSQGNSREVTFSESAKLKRGTKVVQNGNVILPDGKSISLEEAVPPGKLVQIRFRNGNGGETVVPFKK